MLGRLGPLIGLVALFALGSDIASGAGIVGILLLTLRKMQRARPM